MSYVSHKRAPGRQFDCLYDPVFTVPSERDLRASSSTALSRATPTRIQPKYDAMFVNAPRHERMEFRKAPNQFPYRRESGLGLSESASASSGFNSATKLRSLPRLAAGANNPAERKTPKVSLSPSECHKKAPGFKFYSPCPQATMVDLKMDKEFINANYVKHLECRYYRPKPPTPRFKTRGMQTLYRESSAQTLPYLPPAARAEGDVEQCELFKLSTILPGERPPQLYEVEVLERARKRWEFAAAIRKNLNRKLADAREMIKSKEYKNILEAFEWEHWLEREEYIYDCQMMRLELVVRMFNERERDMCNSSKRRVEQRCKEIAARRQQALKKNEIEYGRRIRYLESKQKNEQRNWRRETISRALGNPGSSYYAPELRFGQSPCIRHFQSTRRLFEAHVDDVEKYAVNMKKLTCPYGKLKEWSKPKGRVEEIEWNFCTETNLKKVYDTLRTCREKSVRHKQTPECLVLRKRKELTMTGKTHYEKPKGDGVDAVAEAQRQAELEKLRQLELKRQEEIALELKAEAAARRAHNALIRQEQDREEIETLVQYYAGTTVGWLARFLYEEMQRLNELRKAHYIAILAQKERWWREAAEAGLRQKENEMRMLYEILYQAADISNREEATNFLNNIMVADAKEYAEDRAETNALNLAKLIDSDIQRWLDSFQEIQHPLNYDPLRHLLKDFIFEDPAKAREEYEKKQIIDYIIKDVLFEQVETALEAFDIGTTVANNLIDRAIDDDLMMFSSREGSIDCNCESECYCTLEKREARAILNKLIRYSVPGRRWMTSTERIAEESIKDVLDDVFSKVKVEERPAQDSMSESSDMRGNASYYSILENQGGHNQQQDASTSDDEPGGKVSTRQLSPRTQILCTKLRDITKALDTDEKLMYTDNDSIEDIDVLHVTDYKARMSRLSRMSDITSPVKSIPSELNVDFDGCHDMEHFVVSDPPTPELSDIGILFSEDPIQMERYMLRRISKTFIDEILEEVCRTHDGVLPDGTVLPSSASKPKQCDVRCKCRDKDAEEPEIKPEDQILEVTASELDDIKKERCRCQPEIDRMNLVKEMLRLGRIKIVPRSEKPLQHDVSFYDQSPDAFILSDEEDVADMTETEREQFELKRQKQVRLDLETEHNKSTARTTVIRNLKLLMAIEQMRQEEEERLERGQSKTKEQTTKPKSPKVVEGSAEPVQSTDETTTESSQPAPVEEHKQTSAPVAQRVQIFEEEQRPDQSIERKADSPDQKIDAKDHAPESTQHGSHPAGREPEAPQHAAKTSSEAPITSPQAAETSVKAPDPESSQEAAPSSQETSETTAHAPEAPQQVPEATDQAPEAIQPAPENPQQPPETAHQAAESTEQAVESTEEAAEAAPQTPKPAVDESKPEAPHTTSEPAVEEKVAPESQHKEDQAAATEAQPREPTTDDLAKKDEPETKSEPMPEPVVEPEVEVAGTAESSPEPQADVGNDEANATNQPDAPAND